MKLIRTAVVLVAVGFLAVACSPPSRNNVAVFLSHGAPIALLHPCPGEDVTELAVTDLTTPSAPRPGATTPPDGSAIDLYVPFWDVQAGESDARPTEVRLLSVPSGWRLDQEIVIPLREFREGFRYRLGTTQVGARDVEFTVDDLATLEAGQVWAVSNQGEETAMSRDEFVRLAESHCD